jgi:hypothetical protein
MPSPTPYIVINEPRSGSSWLQEMSMMHPGIKVQFELDMKYGDSALRCMQCHRPRTPDTKHPERLPRKTHPPLACGMTIFGTPNGFREVAALASAYNASLLLLLRRNHVAHAISAYLHFRPRGSNLLLDRNISWEARELNEQAFTMAAGSVPPQSRRCHIPRVAALPPPTRGEGC